ncbi:MAG: hypothetical protein EXR75_00780 [Myxococcales bacterium]|nr:hypothetical protein [Myxococcales bacterium]
MAFRSARVNINKSAQITAVFFVLLALGSGCAARQVPLTGELREEYALADDELRNLQIYVSHDITLRREVVTRRRTIDDGQLVVVGGRNVDEILIERGTPCVVESATSLRVVASCNEGSTLAFVLPASHSSDARRDETQRRAARPFAEAPFAEASFDDAPLGESRGGPTLIAMPARGSGSYGLEVAADGSVVFRGETFTAVGDSAFAHLLIDAKELDETAKSRSTLRGRRVGKAITNAR